MRTTTFTFLFLLLIPFIGFAQYIKPSNFKRVGIGVGYSFNSIVTDSVKPIELSLRYQVSDKHSFQLFTPISISNTTINSGFVNNRKKQLLGIGLGYDYNLYNHTYFDFLLGLNVSYLWYESRRDSHRTYYRDIGNSTFVETESIYYYWDRVKGVVIAPHAGVRFSINNRVMIEPRINILISILDKNSYSFFKTRNPQHESVWGTRESFYSDKDMQEFEIQAGGSIYIYYNF